MNQAPSQLERNSRWILLAALTSALFQLYWFARMELHQIDFDGIDYLGIARHLRQGEFHAAINGFRSPLISWLIAAGSFVNDDLLRVGKVLSIASFLLCTMLVYLFARSLWHSEAVASLAAVWFTLCRGLPAIAVQFVTPDFLFAALTVIYFWILLKCFRNGQVRWWFLLGTAHAIAFLCKGFALPWLGVSTGLALCLRPDRHLKPSFTRLVAAFLLPVIAAGCWGIILHSKYGKFTIGTQFKINFLQWTLHAYREKRDAAYAVLTNEEPNVDKFMVTDLAPPGSWPWTYKIDWLRAIPKIASAEAHYLPQAIKEVLILLTPGGILALCLIGLAIYRHRREYPAEFRLIFVAVVSGITLVVAYCMLVFDARYVYPVIAAFLAIGSRALLGESSQLVPVGISRRWRVAVIGLTVAGVLFSILYRGSPLRSVRYDYQASCYAAAAQLRQHSGATVVTIGRGPYQPHGVGWEAGYKAAFFANRRLIARLNDLPDPAVIPLVLSDLAEARPDAVLIWGNRNNLRYTELLAGIRQKIPNASVSSIDDPELGEVGMIVFPQ